MMTRDHLEKPVSTCPYYILHLISSRVTVLSLIHLKSVAGHPTMLIVACQSLASLQSGLVYTSKCQQEPCKELALSIEFVQPLLSFTKIAYVKPQSSRMAC